MEFLTELQRDALTELINVGVSRAATSLSRMTSEEVRLSVPSLDIVSRIDAVQLLTAGTQESFMAVGIDFAGPFSGRSLLIFPSSNSRDLVRTVLDQTLTSEEVLELEPDALKEIGNVVLIGCLSVISNTLGANLTMALPSLTQGVASDIFEGGASGREMVIFIYVNLNFHKSNMKGYIALAISALTIEHLRGMADTYIARALG